MLNLYEWKKVLKLHSLNLILKWIYFNFTRNLSKLLSIIILFIWLFILRTQRSFTLILFILLEPCFFVEQKQKCYTHAHKIDLQVYESKNAILVIYSIAIAKSLNLQQARKKLSIYLFISSKHIKKMKSMEIIVASVQFYLNIFVLGLNFYLRSKLV